MKLPKNVIISKDKITRYLLVAKKRNDKSRWLAKAGYSLDNWEALETDIRNFSLANEIIPRETTEYGQIFEIKGNIKGPNGGILSVCAIWMTEYTTGDTKFITMYPDKKEKEDEI